MRVQGYKIGIKIFLLTLFLSGIMLNAHAQDGGEGVKKEIENNVKIYWNAMVNLDYEKAYALTDCGDYSFWLSANGSGVGMKDEDRRWFIVKYKVVGIKINDANQAVVVVSYLIAGPNTEGKYFTKAEVWRKRGKNWTRKCDVGNF